MPSSVTTFRKTFSGFLSQKERINHYTLSTESLVIGYAITSEKIHWRTRNHLTNMANSVASSVPHLNGITKKESKSTYILYSKFVHRPCNG